ncbi:unnamed protein product, partial [Laminaria digitata]
MTQQQHQLGVEAETSPEKTMAPLRSMACFVAVSAGTFCGAFVAPGPAQRMSRHTAPTTTTTTAALSRRSIVLQRKSPSSPSSSSTPPRAAVDGGLLFSRRGVDAAPSGAFRSAKQGRQRHPTGALE